MSVKKKEIGLLKASKTYEVPRSTLKDYIKKPTKELQKVFDMPLDRKTVLPPEIEDELDEYCLTMEKCYYELTAKDIKRIALQLAL